jgi:feruloyl-CoA synthase
MTVRSHAELFAPPRIDLRRDPTGNLILSSREELGSYPAHVVDMLRAWANQDPGHPLVARRGVDGEWVTRSYGAIVEAADALGQALLNRGLGQDRPLLILSGNSIEHFLMALGALTAGVPVIPTSVAYSLQSKNHARIKAITGLVRPGAVFADDGARFGAALQALPGIPVVVATEPPAEAEMLDDLLRTRSAEELGRARNAVTLNSVAKILFTSGSTGTRLQTRDRQRRAGRRHTHGAPGRGAGSRRCGDRRREPGPGVRAALAQSRRSADTLRRRPRGFR